MFASSEISSTATKFFWAYASVAGTMMMARSMANELIPHQLRSHLYSAFHYVYRYLFPITDSSKLTLIIYEFYGMERNQVFDAAEIYLRSKVSPNADYLVVSKLPRQKHVTISFVKGETIVDNFNDIEVKWKYQKEEKQTGGETKLFHLVFELKYKAIILDSYLPHVLARAQAEREGEKIVRLYSRDCPRSKDDKNAKGSWGSIHLDHPSTFETLAMDPELKKFIIDDLERFMRRREFYKRVGKAWKRGYLLYGPPGTGKTSLIAAMANYLKFNIYDLELSNVWDNSELKAILLTTTNLSIIVMEDIDCSITRDGYKSSRGLTLSGMLNFIDGLWSSAGDERIIIFTTNHKDKLDPALLRPGRTDVHINMSYCSVPRFKQLTCNYLGDLGKDHYLCGEIEGLIGSTEVTPAEIAGELMRSDDPDISLQGVVDLLKHKETEKSNEIKEQEKNKSDEESSREEGLKANVGNGTKRRGKKKKRIKNQSKK